MAMSEYCPLENCIIPWSIPVGYGVFFINLMNQHLRFLIPVRISATSSPAYVLGLNVLLKVFMAF